MKFTKMQGLGNDYIYVDCMKEHVENPEKLAVKISDRHFGVGSDGLILVGKSEIADYSMRIYNSDGSRQKCAATEYVAWESSFMTTAILHRIRFR